VSCLPESWREIDVRGTASSGSVNIVAVAPTVLGSKNDPGIEEEKTLKTMAPLIPAVKSATSAVTPAACKS